LFLGNAFISNTVGAAAHFHESRQKAYYWFRKFTDPTFHNKSHGGPRNYRFKDPIERWDVQALLYRFVKRYPLARYGEIALFLHNAGYGYISPSWLSNLFCHEWMYSWKKVNYKQRLKFTKENIIHYVEYLTNVRNIPWKRLHFLDEVHLKSSDLRRTRALGPQGNPAVQTTYLPLDVDITITLCVTADPAKQHPILAYEASSGPNNSFDFLLFIIKLIASHKLGNGDYLIFG